MKLKSIGKKIVAALIVPAVVYAFFLVLKPDVFGNISLAINMPSSMKDTVSGGFLLLLMLISDITSRRNAEKARRIAATARFAQSTEE